VLESTCYPEGHLFRFRYEKKYVDAEIWKKPKSFEDKEGMIVFLDTVGEEGCKDFDFFPIRKIRTVRLFPLGLAIYIDFRFGGFIDYGPEDDETRKIAWSSFFEELPNRPWPPPEISGRNEDTHKGYFAMSHSEDNPEFPSEIRIAHETWENMIRRLDKTNDLKDSTFFKILGFYEIKKKWLVGSHSEVPIKSKDNGYDTVYPLPMGKSVILKLLLSRPSYDTKDPQSRRVLKVKLAAGSFAGASKDVLLSDSRYNEERIVIVCKRVFDSVFSTVSIEQQAEPADVQAPKPFLLTWIKVPKSIVCVVISGVVLTTLLLGCDAELIKQLGAWLSPSHVQFFEEKAKILSILAKASAAIPVGISAYFAFRRLPLR
jgi:hypothetical protein